MQLQLLWLENYTLRAVLINTTHASVKFANLPSFFITGIQVKNVNGQSYLPFDLRSIQDTAFKLKTDDYKELKPGEKTVLWEDKFYPLDKTTHLFGFHCGPLSWEWPNPSLKNAQGSALPAGKYKIEMTFVSHFDSARDKNGAIVLVPGVWKGEINSNLLEIDLK